MIVVINSVLAGVVTGLLWRSVAGSSGPVALAVSAAVGFLVNLVSLYGQRAFRRDLRRQRWPSRPAPTGEDHR